MNWIRFVVVCICFFGLNCQKLLDIKPKNLLVESEAIKTPADCQKLLNSAYDILRSDDFLGGAYWSCTDLLADDVDGSGLTGTLGSFYSRSSSIANEGGRKLWSIPYQCIFRCNLLLEKIPKISGFTPTEKARMRGECLFLRGYCHWLLVNLFAQPYGYTADNSHDGIPLRLQANQDLIPRSSVAVVFNQILTDLNNSVIELPADVKNGYANVWAAKAVLARVYFQIGNFLFAYNNSKSVVENGPFIFGDSVKQRISKKVGNEMIFALASTGIGKPGESSGNRLLENYRSLNGRPPILIPPTYYKFVYEDSNDLRLTRWMRYVKGASGFSDLIYPTKYNITDYYNVPLIHLGEVKLIMAESAAELGKLTESLIQLNDVRNRAGLVTFSTVYQSKIIEETRRQRRIEMMLEGNRLWELKRQAIRGNKSLKIRNAPWDCWGLILQIPDEEVGGNPDIKQNPVSNCN